MTKHHQFQLLRTTLELPLPTPEHIRKAMVSAGWILSLDLVEGRRRSETWAFGHRNVMKQAGIDLASWRVPQVTGNLETIGQGLAILAGSPSHAERGETPEPCPMCGKAYLHCTSDCEGRREAE